MKNLAMIVVILLLIFNFQFSTCYSQEWEWSTVIKDYESAMTVWFKADKDKSSYIGSYFRNITYPIGLTSSGYNDIFLAKYDSVGSLIWLKKFGGNNPLPTAPDWIVISEGLYSFHLDTLNNNIFVSGQFYNNAIFVTITLTSYSPNTLSSFLMKMDLDGNVIWAKRMPLYIYGMNTDGNENLFLGGGVTSTAQIDSSNTVDHGSVIIKLNSNGECIWVKKITNWINDFRIKDIKLYNSDIVINGYTNNDTIIIDTIIKLVPPGTKWSALARLDNNGNAKWLNMYGGNNSQSASDFSMDNEGNIYSTGYFTGIGYFGNDTITSTTNQKNMFLAKHNINGQIQWTKQINATSSQGYCVSNVVDSSLFVTGYFKGTAYFNDTITATTAQDMFIARYSNSGICKDVKYFGKAEGIAVTQDELHAAYVAGNYYTDITIGNTTHALSSFSDIFIAKLKGDTATGIEQRKENAKNNLLTIYANPTTGKCNVTIPEEFNYENNLTLQIFDKSGKMIQQSKVEVFEDNIKVNIESEAKGIYNVVLSNGKTNYNGKIVFE